MKIRLEKRAELGAKLRPTPPPAPAKSVRIEQRQPVRVVTTKEPVVIEA